MTYTGYRSTDETQDPNNEKPEIFMCVGGQETAVRAGSNSEHSKRFQSFAPYHRGKKREKKTYAQNDQSKAKMYVTRSSTTIGSSHLSVESVQKRRHSVP